MKLWHIDNTGSRMLTCTFFFLIGPAALRAQFPTPTPHNSPMGNHNAADDEDKHISASSQEKMAIARNDERQKRLVADTNKLVALVTQLKTDVDKSDKYMLSLDVVRRSEEIEKLARSIKDRAKN